MTKLILLCSLVYLFTPHPYTSLCLSSLLSSTTTLFKESITFYLYFLTFLVFPFHSQKPVLHLTLQTVPNQTKEIKSNKISFAFPISYTINGHSSTCIHQWGGGTVNIRTYMNTKKGSKHFLLHIYASQMYSTLLSLPTL